MHLVYTYKIYKKKEQARSKLKARNQTTDQKEWVLRNLVKELMEGDKLCRNTIRLEECCEKATLLLRWNEIIGELLIHPKNTQESQ